MATSLDEVTKSQVGLLRWTDMHRRVRAFVDGQVVVDSAEPIQVWEPYRVVGSYAVRTADIAAPTRAPRTDDAGL